MASPSLIPRLSPRTITETTEGSKGSLRKEGIKEHDENSQPASQTPSHTPVDKRRTSESGIPSARRLSSGGTPFGGQTTPRIVPRENRSSSLRKSMSGVDSNSLRASGDGSPSALGLELNRLRDDLRVKQRQNEKLEVEASTLKSSLATKERALARNNAENEAARAKLLQTEGDLANKVRDLRGVESERNKLRAALQELEREAEKMNRRLNAAPKGTGLSEAVATLEAEVKKLKAENAELDGDRRGVWNQLRAKDKQLDVMAAEVEQARAVQIHNLELENYMLDLRRQLQEAADERSTLLTVQRQMRTEMAKLSEAADEANREKDALARELASCKTQLKGSEENASELSRELELRCTELTRVTNVATRASVREVGSMKEEGTVPYVLHKEEVMHLKGENDRTKEQLRLAQKSLAARQTLLNDLHSKVDSLQGKTPSAKSPNAAAKSAEAGLKRSTFGGRRESQG